MRIVALAASSFAPIEKLRHVAGVEMTRGETADSLRDAIREAEVMVLAPRYGSVLRELWPDAKRLRWIHALGAGVEKMPFDLLRESDVVVTNSRGIYADGLAEFVIASMLHFAKDFRRLLRNQAERKWEPATVQRLEGSTAGIVGFGGTGRAVGRRAEALGMKIASVRRHEGDIDEVVAQSDYLVISTPLTRATTRLINRERIALMRPTSVLINISRGQIVDEAALIEALLSKRIRGAALDVFETEPLPQNSTLWSLDNVVVSPHSADRTADSHERAMAFFLAQLERFRIGAPLENVVDKAEEY